MTWLFLSRCYGPTNPRRPYVCQVQNHMPFLNPTKDFPCHLTKLVRMKCSQRRIKVLQKLVYAPPKVLALLADVFSLSYANFSQLSFHESVPSVSGLFVSFSSLQFLLFFAIKLSGVVWLSETTFIFSFAVLKNYRKEIKHSLKITTICLIYFSLPDKDVSEKKWGFI